MSKMSKNCASESNDVHLRAKCSFCCKFNIFSKIWSFLNVQKCTFESNDVHLRTKFSFCDKFDVFSKIWSFLNVKKYTFESNDVHLRAKFSFFMILQPLPVNDVFPNGMYYKFRCLISCFIIYLYVWITCAGVWRGL